MTEIHRMKRATAEIARLDSRLHQHQDRPSPQVGESTDKWTVFPDWHKAAIHRQRWTVQPISGLGQILVRGEIAKGVETFVPGAHEVGLWGVARSLPYVVRVARDTVLVVSSEPIACEPGWRPGGWSATPAESANLIFDIAGDALAEVISEGSSADLEAGSPSATTLFAGIPCMIYRTSACVARLHVENSLAPYLWRWLETRAD